MEFDCRLNIRYHACTPCTYNQKNDFISWIILINLVSPVLCTGLFIAISLFYKSTYTAFLFLSFRSILWTNFLLTSWLLIFKALHSWQFNFSRNHGVIFLFFLLLLFLFVCFYMRLKWYHWSIARYFSPCFHFYFLHSYLVFKQGTCFMHNNAQHFLKALRTFTESRKYIQIVFSLFQFSGYMPMPYI
jgi:hypothetical protein